MSNLEHVACEALALMSKVLSVQNRSPCCFSCFFLVFSFVKKYLCFWQGFCQISRDLHFPPLSWLLLMFFLFFVTTGFQESACFNKAWKWKAKWRGRTTMHWVLSHGPRATNRVERWSQWHVLQDLSLFGETSVLLLNAAILDLSNFRQSSLSLISLVKFQASQRTQLASQSSQESGRKVSKRITNQDFAAWTMQISAVHHVSIEKDRKSEDAESVVSMNKTR